ncbi:hypothetical protein Tco_0801772 [Tanacetum coccineum]|uniref:Uncharacterized protein n=1 Tax=Tanacetum coccineum TaxID=301880 RepID=A0ABQ4ZWX4_9ASTR
MNNQAVWQSRDQDLTPQIPENLDLVYVSCERDLHFTIRYLYNKDLFFLKHGNTKARKYVVSLHNFHATSFLEDDLEEVFTRWVDPDEVFSNQKSIEIIRVLHHETYEQDLMDEICVKRANGKAYFFSESNYKYLNKNDIEDMHYICLRRKKNTQQTALIKSLIVFIRSCQKEKRVVNIDELKKFCDATLKIVLKNVNVTNVETRHDFKDPPLSKKDKELMSHSKCVGNGVVIEEIVEENVVSSSGKDSKLLMIEWPVDEPTNNENVGYLECDNEENMSIGMEIRGNGRVLDEKCTKLILKRKATTLLGYSVTLGDFHVMSNYVVTHIYELCRTFAKILKEHVQHGSYGVAPHLRLCRSRIEAISTSPKFSYFVIHSTRDSQVTTRASLEGIFQLQSPSFQECSKMGDVDINTLTMERYLALTRGNQTPCMVKPEIGNNVNF